ncbi:MAG: hypothetical protein COV67_10710 [Nitrospinae bacterium CG11_big_fil_rev_8_21_14_0_20_56_8]|nr:MAG: hypothetical protein COV67_10710 [Nitrospinae bacterium CG11_big_fil_rev_8_21_14_0_20_56_8]
MKRINTVVWIFALFLGLQVSQADAQDFASRFAKGQSSFGLDAGFGYTIDLPPGRDRADLSFVFFFPNYEQNLTGLLGKGTFYQGALYWHVEAGLAELVNRDGEYLFGFSPLMVDYKFVDANRGWAPHLLAGGGFSYTNWKDQARRELGTEFEFLLHAGAGVEFFGKGSSSWALNYRFFHVSNAGIEFPNIGLNAHVFSVGYRF